MNQLDKKKLEEDSKSYLIQANVEILRSEELLQLVRYDRIKIGREVSDRYDPFQMVPKRDDISPSLCNSYIDDMTPRHLTTDQ